MKIREYIRETKNELKEVKWLSRRETVGYTIAVIIFSLLMAVFLWVVDLGFQAGLKKIIVPEVLVSTSPEENQNSSTTNSAKVGEVAGETENSKPKVQSDISDLFGKPLEN